MHRLYVKGDITIFWNSDKCYHAKKCVTGCPEVFDINKKPWINLEGADSAKIWQTIEKCPSGALTVTYNHGIDVNYDEAGSRSVALFDNREIGECDYDASTGEWVIYHTEVSPEFGGKQIARRLVYKLLEEAEKRKIPVSATCSYAVKVMGE